MEKWLVLNSTNYVMEGFVTWDILYYLCKMAKKFLFQVILY